MRVLVVGGGRIGSYLAEDLESRGHQVVIVEKDDHRSRELTHRFEKKKIKVVTGDGDDPNVLREAGVREVDVIAAATGHDEDNLVVGLLGKREFGIKKIVGRVNNPKNSWLYSEPMGFDAAVQPAEIIVSLIEETIEKGQSDS